MHRSLYRIHLLTSYKEAISIAKKTVSSLESNNFQKYTPRRLNSNATTTITTNTEVNFQDVAQHRRTYSEEEVNKFSKMSENWWDPEGVCKPLHSMNDLRIPLVRDGLIQKGVCLQDEVNGPTPLTGIKILDVGCGAGILCEPLARLGARVTGVDASESNINVAKRHAEKDHRVSSNVQYFHGTVEEHAEKSEELYDAVIASEVLEHVTDPNFFIDTCTSLIKPGGSIFITSINKTCSSWLGAIVAAEYIFNLLPKGTHEWDKFVPLHQLKSMLETNLLNTRLLHGMIYLPILDKWKWTSNSSVNYALHAVKQS